MQKICRWHGQSRMPHGFQFLSAKDSFKRWGKLWSPGSVRLQSSERAKRRERRDYSIGTVLYQLPLPPSIKTTLTGKRYGFKKRVASRPAEGQDQATSFLLECYNPQSYNIPLSLTIRAVDEEVRIPFQKLFDVTPGLHRIRVPMDEIRRVFDVRVPFTIELIPNDVEDGTTLYFGLMEFVQEVEQSAEKTKKIKCVVWDLDNTLWDGVLVEDGPEKLKFATGHCADDSDSGRPWNPAFHRQQEQPR